MKNFSQSKKGDFVFQLRFPALANRVFYKETLKTIFIQFSFYVVHRPKSPVFSKYVRKFSPVFYFMCNESWKLDIFFFILNVFFYTIDLYLPSYNNLLPTYQLFYVCTHVLFLELYFGKLEISGDSSFHNFGRLSLFFRKKKKKECKENISGPHAHVFHSVSSFLPNPCKLLKTFRAEVKEKCNHF